MPHPNTVEINGPGVYPLDPVRKCSCPCHETDSEGVRLNSWLHTTEPAQLCPRCGGTGQLGREDGAEVSIFEESAAYCYENDCKGLVPRAGTPGFCDECGCRMDWHGDLWPPPKMIWYGLRLEEDSQEAPVGPFDTAQLAYTSAVRAYEESKR